MLAMMSVIVDYTFKNAFLTFYIRQVGPLKRCGPVITPPHSPSWRAWVHW